MVFGRTLASINARTNQLVTLALIWLGIAVASLFLYFFNPASPANQALFPKCPFRALTGFACPGCGSTRGLHRLVHGDVVGAFEFNPLMVVALPFLLYALVRYTNAALRGRPLKRHQLNTKYIWALLVVILSFWVFRNTPFYPFPI
jgi:hypothetical protein